MTRPRKEQIDLSVTPYYHLMGRCVRRSFLCGDDPLTKQNFDHRRDWIVDRIRLLSSIFTVDIAAYAIMSNHIHLVVKIDPLQALKWTRDDIISRWRCLYKGPPIIGKYLSGRPLEDWEERALNAEVARFESELKNISRFMQCLNEAIARQANKEDGCTGHFWEGRFKSQPLMTEHSLLSCMAYVDLNSVRVGLSDTPENSKYTSIRERILGEFEDEQAMKSFEEHGGSAEAFKNRKIVLKPLLAFTTIGQDNLDALPITELDYLELVDQTGRVARENKKGQIRSSAATILQRLGLNKTTWLEECLQFEKYYRRRSVSVDGV